MAGRAESTTIQGLLQFIAANRLLVDMNAHLPRLNLIGCGRVGQTLAHLWQRQGCVQTTGLYSLSVSSAQTALEFVGAGVVTRTLANLPPAEIWLIAVSDTAIANVADQLAKLPLHDSAPAAPLALHCSGFQSSEALQTLANIGWHTASAHPVRSFAAPSLAAQGFAGTPVALEGDATAGEVVQRLFESIGARCFSITREAKPLYHAASVFANNFTTVLQGVAQDLWQHCSISPDMARELDLALLESTLANLRSNTPAQALTGPAARGDTAVVQAQGKAVTDWNPKVGEIYARMSEMAARLKRQSHPNT